MKLIRIGTRGSDLALAQALLTETALRHAWPNLNLSRNVIQTTGDAHLNTTLRQLHIDAGLPADKGTFTKEIETALVEKHIDVAVHSLKDVPTLRPPGLEIVATLPRANPVDILITKISGGWDAIPPDTAILTGSPRRERLIHWLHPHLHTKPIRGNVPTRLQKFLTDHSATGLILARAGLERLGFSIHNHILTFGNNSLPCTVLPLDTFPHAVGQAAVGLEIRSDDDTSRHIVAPLNHAPTYQLTRMERHFLRLLNAGCHTPVGVTSMFHNGRLWLQTMVFDEKHPDAPPQISQAEGDTPETTAQLAFSRLSVNNQWLTNLTTGDTAS